MFHPNQTGLGIIGTPDIDRGFKFMGAPVGSSEYQRVFMNKKLIQLKANNEVLRLVAKHDIQQFLIYFSSCRWHQSIGYYARLLPPTIMEPILIDYEDHMWKMLEDVMGNLDPFRRQWLSLSKKDQGLNLFNLVEFGRAGFIAATVEFQRYQQEANPTHVIQPTEECLVALQSYVDSIGGWNKIPPEWSQGENSTTTLFHSLVSLVQDKDSSIGLQHTLHSMNQQYTLEQCDLAAREQHPVIQQTYLSVRAAQSNGMIPFTVLPTGPKTTIPSAMMRVIFCKQYALPLEGITPSTRCPGTNCRDKLDPTGAHLYNCKKISTLHGTDAYSRTQLHNDVAEAMALICCNKYYNVVTNPKDQGSRPLLPNGVRGQLDIRYVHRQIDGGETSLGDISVCNPINASVLRGDIRGQTPNSLLNNIRTKKQNKYQNAIREQLQDKALVVFPFTTHGQIGFELETLFSDVAGYVHSRNKAINKSLLIRRYRNDVLCTLHKGVARVLLARMDLIRARTNQFPQRGQNLLDIQNGLVDMENFETPSQIIFRQVLDQLLLNHEDPDDT